MRNHRPFVLELFTAAGLIAAPFVLPYLGFAPTTIDRILIWGLFGIGFDILFGFTGLLSFGQSALYGTGGMITAYLLAQMGFPYVTLALFIGMIGAAIVGYLVGLIALRRTGIYFAMITVAIAEVFYFVEFNPLSAFTGGENGIPGVPTPSLYLGFTTLEFDSDWGLYGYLAFWFFIGIVIALRIVRSPVGIILSAIRDNPLRAAALGHNIHSYKLTAFVIAAAYAGFAGGLLGLMQGFMPPDAFTFDTSGQLVMQTAIGGTGTLFGPLVGAAVWLFLSDFFQTTLQLGATWKLVLGIVFVLLVVFLRRGLIGGGVDLIDLVTRRTKTEGDQEPDTQSVSRLNSLSAAATDDSSAGADAPPPVRRRVTDHKGPMLEARALTQYYGGLAANRDINFSVDHGEIRGIIGPNGAGKSTFFKMLTCEVPPTSGHIFFEGRDITGMNVSDVCQLGLTKSYQVNQLFTRLTVRENLTIAVSRADPRQVPAGPVPQPGQGAGAGRAGWAYAGADPADGARRRAGVGARLRREAAVGDRTGARHLAKPAAARRAACRHEPERAGGDGQAAQVDCPGPHHDRHRPRHGLAVRGGRADHRAAGRQRADRRHARRDQGRSGRPGSLSRRRP